MWFKNIYVFRFTKPFELSVDELSEALEESPFTPCSANDISKIGWTAPLGKKHTSLVHVTNGYWMLTLTKQDRMLPSSVVNEQVMERVEEIENSQHRKVSRKEKTELKEQVTIELMPRAFTKTARISAYLCPSKNYLVVNSSSAKVVDEFTSFLRKCVGSLPIRMLNVKTSPTTSMTEWLKDPYSVPDNFELGMECEIRSHGEEAGQVKYKGLELHNEQLEQHVGAGGMLASKLSLTWNEKISFTLNEDLTLKRLKFSDLVQEKVKDIDSDDAASQFDASFSIMTAEIDQLIPHLVEAFGGEVIDA